MDIPPSQRARAQDPMLDMPVSRWLRLYALIMGLLLLLAHGSAYAQEPLRPGGGTLFLGLPGQSQPATRVSTQAQIRVSGLIAQASVTQIFRNDGVEWTEGVYVFPLPEDAAVNRLRMRVGARVIEGEIKELAQAKAVYTAAKQAGQRASLVEQERPNLFTTSVANIGPGEEIRVEITYLQTVRYEQGEFRLRFPMTFTPRYVPGAPIEATADYRPSKGGWAAPTDQVPDAHRITPPIQHPIGGPLNPTELTVQLKTGLQLARLESRHHPVEREDKNGGIFIELATTRSDRDFELVWAPTTEQAPVAAIFGELIEGEAYAMVMLVPPHGAAQSLPREVVFVIDTSGSMSGDSIRQARAALLLALERLGPQDRFNVIQFNSYTHQLFPAPVPATPQTLRQARGYVRSLIANGGTEMAPALGAALTGETPGGFLRQVVFITDGAVSNEAALFGQIQRDLGAARLFTVGIGSAPNSYFMTKAASFGRGSFTYVGSVGEVQTRMSELFARLESPVLRDLCVRWPQQAEMYPAKLPDLYAGEPVMLVARLSKLTGAVEICGETAGQPWRRRLRLEGQHADAGVATVWARQKIESLMDKKYAGVSEEQVRAEVLPLALRHRLVTSYTSFVAVDKTPARPAGLPLKNEALPHNLPAGAKPNGFGVALPQTATPAPMLFASALASLLLALALHLASRRRLA